MSTIPFALIISPNSKLFLIKLNLLKSSSLETFLLTLSAKLSNWSSSLFSFLSIPLEKLLFFNDVFPLFVPLFLIIKFFGIKSSALVFFHSLLTMIAFLFIFPISSCNFLTSSLLIF